MLWFVSTVPCFPQQPVYTVIEVVMDNNYPPYVFLDSQGNAQGILIDQWHLWEKKTGIPVEISALDWSEALRRMRAGEFDVIDTIFKTEGRLADYEFGKPYARIEVPIFFHKSLSGITNLDSLKGFPVAAKEGDDAEDFLQRAGVKPILLFKNYEAIVKAAAERKVSVFVADDPPAIYFLNKQGLGGEFKKSLPVNVGDFHRAVHKRKLDLLKRVEDGFAAITPEEYQAIEHKWFGTGLFSKVSVEPLLYPAGFALALILFLLVWNRSLRRMVARRTEALQGSEARYRLLFEKNPVPVFIYDRATLRLLAVNEAFLHHYGYSSEEAHKLILTDLYRQEERARIAARVIKLKGYYNAGEWHHLLRDGTVIMISIISHDIHYAGCDCRIAVATDITERKKAEQELQRLTAWLKGILDQAAYAVISTTPEGMIQTFNPAAERMLGYAASELIGISTPELFHDAEEMKARALALSAEPECPQLSGFDVLVAQARRNHGGEEEWIYVRRDGARFPVMLNVTALRDSQGGIVGFLAIVRDISEQRRLEHQLLRNQRLESVGRLAGGVAHDLNNILLPMLMAPAIIRETATDPEALAMLETIETSARRGSEILQQLLTYARGSEARREPMSLEPVVQEIAKMVQETFPKNLNLSCEMPTVPVFVSANATQMHQVLLNLCVNARDAMPQGGALRLVLTQRELDSRAAQAIPDAKPGSYAELTVCDTGTGISPEYIERIFDPFFTTKKAGEGTGLGLSSVLGIVRSHGGCIQVHSELGRGTRFTLLLPLLAQTVQVASPKGEGAQRVRGSGELILVVDDEESIRRVIARSLKGEGYQVLDAADGVQALDLVRQKREELRLIITDLMMPNMDGPSLVVTLRKEGCRVPVLAISGQYDRAKVDEQIGAEVSAILSKPFEQSDLLAAVAKVLS